MMVENPALQPAVADPSSALRAPSPTRGEGEPETSGVSTTSDDAVPSPSPLVGEGARRADEGWPSVPATPRRRSPKADRHEVKPRLRAFARRLRTASTEEERLLWSMLRNRRFSEFKFRRQVPIDRYIVDFVCQSAQLVVELDGSQHAESARDFARDAAIARHGYRIVRVWNHELTHARDSVLDAIWYALQPPEGDHS